MALIAALASVLRGRHRRTRVAEPIDATTGQNAA
jgi:hypothetical protein